MLIVACCYRISAQNSANEVEIIILLALGEDAHVYRD